MSDEDIEQESGGPRDVQNQLTRLEAEVSKLREIIRDLNRKKPGIDGGDGTK